MKHNLQDTRPQAQKGSHRRFRAKFIWHSQSRNPFPVSQMYLILAVSYLQIFFMTTRFLRDYTENDSSALRVGLKHLEDIITFDNLLYYTRAGFGVPLALIIILVYFLLIIADYFMLRHCIKTKQKPHGLFNAFWAFIIRFHNPILFFMVNNFCGRIQKNYVDDSLNMFEQATLNQVVLAFSIIIFVINVIVSLSLDLFLCDSLPAKNPMSSKNSHTDRITLFQKLFLTLLWRFLPKKTFANWLIIVLNLAISCIKHAFYYYTFPRYQIRTLKFNAYMLTLEASIVIMAPLITVLNEIDDVNISLSSAIIMIVILFPFLVAGIRGIMNHSLKEILYAPSNQLNAHKLVHRLIILKEVRAYKGQFGEDKDHISRKWLNFAGVSSHWKDIFNEEDKAVSDLDFADKEVQNQAIRQFLEQMNKRYPHNNLVKLTLIRFYIKPLKLFPLAISHLGKVNSFSFRDKLSVGILYLEIQRAISAYYKQTDSVLDMADYLSTMRQFETFDGKVWTQLNLYKNFWTEYNKTSPDTTKLYELSEKINTQKKIVHSDWNRSTFNKEYSQPFLLYACYLFTLEDSPQKGQQYLKTFNLLNHRDKDDSKSQELSRKNLYFSDTFYITIRTDAEHVGRIAKCSASIRRTLQYDPKSLVGTNVNQLMSTYMGQNHNQMVLGFVRTGQAKFLNQIQNVFIKDKHGFLHKASQFTKVHPFFTHEIFLTAIIRPIKTSEEFILVTPQGQIDSTTSGVAHKLGLDGKKISMISICPDFEKINKIFNKFGSKQINPTLQENAQGDEDSKFYERWASEGDDLRFFVSDGSRSTGQLITCFCHIENYYFASDFIKIVTIKGLKTTKAGESSLTEAQLKNIGQQQVAGKDKLVARATIDHNLENSFDFAEIDEKDKPKASSKPHIIDLRRKPHKQSLLFATNHLGDADLSATKGAYREGMGSVNILTNSNVDKSNEKKNKESETALSSSRKVKVQFMPLEGSIGSTSTNKTTRNRIYSVVSESLKRKMYTRPAYIFLLLCLCLAAALFASQLALQEKVRSDLNTLEALGTTLDYANTGVDALLFLSRGARISFQGQIGIIDIVNSSTAAAYITTFRSALSVYLPILTSSNNGLWTSLETIDENFRNKVLDLNLEFFDFYPNLTIESSQKVNTLTGMVLLQSKLLKIQKYYEANGKYDLTDLIYVMLNACNDLLVQNKDLAEAVQNFITTSIQDQHVSLDILFSGGMAVIVIGLCFGCAYSLIFYKLEVKRLNSFVRLSEQEISSIQENLSQFEEILKTQEYKFLRQQTTMRSQTLVHKDKDKVKVKAFSKNKQSFRLPDTKRLKKSYFIKVGTWTLILGIYTIFITVVYTRVYENGSSFESGINRLISVQSFLEHMQVCLVGFYAIFIPEYEPFVENQDTMTVLESNLVDLSEGATTLTKAYTLSDGTLDPVIKPIFSGNICSVLSGTDLARCQLVAPGAQVKDLFTVISALYTEFTQGIDLYVASDQSFASGQKILTAAFISVTPIVVTLRGVLLYMINQARMNFNNIYDTLLDHLMIYLAVQMVLFWSLFVAAWFSVIRYLMSYNNRMKAMLMVIPVRVLITNKSLKPLLMKTCKGKLDTIRNDF